MKNLDCKPIQFDNWQHFDSFVKELEHDSNWIKINYVDSNAVDVGFLKSYFKNLKSGEIWELVEPDPPFKGDWHKT